MPFPLAARQSNLLQNYCAKLTSGDVIANLQAGLIGSNASINGPFGEKPLVYADYVASGRALMQTERFIIEEVLPYYANSHTEASYCGGLITRLRRDARAVIAELCGADEKHAVIFTGSGATAGLNRLVSLFGVTEAVTAGREVRILIGPYEHHSNILPWRESGAKVIEIAEAASGGPELAMLAAELEAARSADITICAFSAASNVTGITSDIATITRMANAAGAKMIWDYAGAGPYLPITMSPAPDCQIDAIACSPHKFIGGPGASGVLIVRKDGVTTTTPTWSGGGTVRFVNSMHHDYTSSLEAREEAGTPNVLGDIRAALAFLVKHAIGEVTMTERNSELTAQAMLRWRDNDRLVLLGNLEAQRLPIFSFCIRDNDGGFIHQQLITRLLSDKYGIQARGGCACAGPYVHHLLDISDADSEALRREILSGNEMVKPGFTRLNLSVLLTPEKVDYILESVLALANEAPSLVAGYDYDPNRAIFFPKAA